METARPTVEFDHNSVEFARDPAGELRKVRTSCPVAWSARHGGYWVLTRYRDVAQASHDDDTFSSAAYPPGSTLKPILIPSLPRPLPSIPIELDPPEFYLFRRLLNPILSPAAVERMRPLIERQVRAHIDEVIERGECDLVGDFASPVPAAVTLEWLGMDVGDARRCAFIQHTVLASAPDSPEFLEADGGFPWMHERILDAVAERRARPREDAISYLGAQRVDGEPLSDETLLSIIQLIIAGGVDTTTSLTGQTLAYLNDRPDERVRLLRDAERMRIATEEFLRFFCPVQALARTVVKGTEVSGVPMHPGEKVLLSWASANRDPEMFADPEEVVLERFPNRHMAFGLGIHRCAGSNLARAVYMAMMRGVLERMPDYRIDMTGADTYPLQGVNTGFAHLPARFTAGPRSAG